MEKLIKEILKIEEQASAIISKSADAAQNISKNAQAEVDAYAALKKQQIEKELEELSRKEEEKIAAFIKSIEKTTEAEISVMRDRYIESRTKIGKIVITTVLPKI